MLFKKRERKVSCKMGWRYVLYQEDNKAVLFAIEPMVEGSDIVYLPSESAWKNFAPKWLISDKKNIFESLKNIKWNRELKWLENDSSTCTEIRNDSETVIPGTLESTQGGQYLENQWLFNPGQKISFESARQIWFDAAAKFATLAKGKATIFCKNLVSGSVFEKIELPILKKNPNVILDIK